LNAEVSLEILQDKLPLRLKSMESIFQSSAKLSESEHTESKNICEEPGREATLTANVTRANVLDVR